jgi:hypothetical protein
MKARVFFAALCASGLAAAQARADDTMVHVTGNGPAMLVEETTAGQRTTLCATLPCDIKANPNGAYRFVSIPGRGVRKSQLFILPNGPRVDLDVDVRSETRRIEGFVLIGVGSAAVVAGIVLTVVGYEMNQQVPRSGEVYQDVGIVAGIIAGLLTLAWGAGDAARNAHSRISATPSSDAPPPPTPTPSPPPAAMPPEAPPQAAIALPARQAFVLPLFSMRF